MSLSSQPETNQQGARWLAAESGAHAVAAGEFGGDVDRGTEMSSWHGGDGAAQVEVRCQEHALSEALARGAALPLDGHVQLAGFKVVVLIVVRGG